MRASSSKLLYCWAWAVPVLAATIPLKLTPSPAGDPKDTGRYLDIDFQQNYAQATFSVPCAGCLGEGGEAEPDDDALLLSFTANAANSPCGTSNITLNGEYLPQEWRGGQARGSGHLDLKDAWYTQHQLDLEWQSTCLFGNESSTEEHLVEDDDVAQLLTVTIKSIDGKPLRNPSGFTISYRQLSPPELLRFEAIPNRSASDLAFSESWREPPPHLRLLRAKPKDVLDNTETPQLSIEEQIQEIKALQAEAKKLEQIIRAKKQHVKDQLKQQFKSFKEELGECENISCYFKTVAEKARESCRLAYLRLRPHDKSSDSEMGKEDPYAQVWRPGGHKQAQALEADVDGSFPTPPPDHDDILPERPFDDRHGPSTFTILISAIFMTLCCVCVFSAARRCCCSSRKCSHVSSVSSEATYHPRPRKSSWRRLFRRNNIDADRIADYEEKRALISSQEDLLESSMQEEIRQLRAAHDLVTNSLVPVEEGRCMTCFRYSYSQQPSISAVANNHNPNPMHDEPRHREWHPPYPGTPSTYPSSASTYSPTTSSFPSLSRPPSRTSSLPEYRSDRSDTTDPPDYRSDRSDSGTEPPAYEDDQAERVVDGFGGYRPTSAVGDADAEVDWTPDSSVVDVSPRPSAETLRLSVRTEVTGQSMY